MQRKDHKSEDGVLNPLPELTLSEKDKFQSKQIL